MIENEAKTVENLTETDKLDMVTGGVASRVDPYAKRLNKPDPIQLQRECKEHGPLMRSQGTAVITCDN